MVAMVISGPSALIDLSALRHNLQCARDAAPDSRVIAVIKANAYGHGMLRAAAALDSADAFAVARVVEGVSLREAGCDKEILVLEGCFDGAELSAASQYRLELAINQSEQLDMLEQAVLPDPVRCWLKLDTGMHRLGFQVSAARDAHRRLLACDNVHSELRLMTHLANADDLKDDASRMQISEFIPIEEAFGIPASIANSAAILGWPESHRAWNRPGIMLYGASPIISGRAVDYGLKPVMTLSSHLIAVNHYAKGAALGYGGSWCCPEAMPVGVVAIGYGDGYPRHARAGTPVLLNGKRVPLVGRVSMDMISLDLRTQPDARPGDPVVLWGRGLPSEEIAECAQTISYELFCGVTSRVPFGAC